MNKPPRKKRVYKKERAQRQQKRNQDICNRFDSLCKANPQWRVDAILDKIAAEFYLSPSTIYMIIRDQTKSTASETMREHLKKIND